MYLCRVPVRQYPPQRPHCLVEDAPGTYVGPETLRVAHPLTPCKMDTIAPHIHVLTRDIPFIPQGTLSTSTWSHLVLNIIPNIKKAVPGEGHRLEAVLS